MHWAETIAALVIVVFMTREAMEAWKGQAGATSIGMLDDHPYLEVENHDTDG